jgi:hypothetical protein
MRKIAVIIGLLLVMIAVTAWALTLPTAPQQSIPEQWAEEMRDQP